MGAAPDRLSEVHGKTGAELGTKQTSQIPPHNTIVDEFGTSLPLNFGKTNCKLGAL